MAVATDSLLRDLILPSRTTFLDLIGPYYPFSRVGARSLFEECTIQHLSSPSDSLKILLLGCGDLRKALATVADRTRKSDRLQVHLNDSCPSIIARNILFLAIIDEKGFDVENREHIDFLWDVWFNAKWEKPTSKRFAAIVQRLLDGYLPPNVFVLQGCDALTEVLKKWQASIGSGGCMQPDLMRNLSSERKKSMCARWMLEESVAGRKYEPWDPANDETPFRDVTTKLSSKLGVLLASGPFTPFSETDLWWARVRQEIIYYLEHGYCYIGKRNSPAKYVTFNPTFLDPSNNAWRVDHSLTPFEGFFSLIDNETLKKNVTRDGGQHSISLLSVCQDIFKKQIADYKKSRPAGLYFHIRHPLEFCLDTSASFDLIDCSLLGDTFGLANVLLATRSRLSDHPDALVITSSRDWLAGEGTSFAGYVQIALGVPVSMIPTIYGFKLATAVEFGDATPTVEHIAKMAYATLIWRRCPDFDNVVFTPSPTIEKCFSALFGRSFMRKSALPVSTDQLSSFTPLTYHLIANNLVFRFGLNPSEVDVNGRLSLEITPAFQLQYRTFNSWAAGSKLLRRFTSSEFKATEVGRLVLQGCYTATPRLRLVLIRRTFLPQQASTESLPVDFDMDHDDVHFIDSFTYCRKEGANQQLSFSFILIPDNGIESTHHAAIYDVRLSKILFYVGQLSDMRQEPFKQAYPLLFTKKTSKQGDGEGPVKMIRFLESEDDYKLEIDFNDPILHAAVKFGNESKYPCEAALVCSLGYQTLAGWRSITFRMAHAFSIEGVFNSFGEQQAERNATRILLHYNPTNATRVVKFALLKATTEPWAHDFRRKPSDKIDPDSLKPLSSGSDLTNTVVDHLRKQFTKKEIKNPSTMSNSTLNLLRQMTDNIFMRALMGPESCDKFFALRDTANAPEASWFIRIHGPVRCDRNGVPFLSLTVQDRHLVMQLVAEDKLPVDTAVEEHMKIFPDTMYTTSFESSEVAELFRYLLRMNSTKVLLNSWQKKHLSTRQTTSWMATFITPLYQDRSYALRLLMKRAASADAGQQIISPSSSQSQLAAPMPSCNTCNNCRKSFNDKLKVCGKCKIVYYCGPECQKADWPKHKLVCKPPVI